MPLFIFFPNPLCSSVATQSLPQNGTNCIFSRQPSLWTVIERSLGTTQKSPNTRGKVLFLNSLKELTLKGKFVPYLASFSSLIHLLELKLCFFGGGHPWCSSSF
ncbi:hypothetical protein PVAP13_1NG122357 [Panicum virgatum]|uniref:Uncharacterized protein n=1 Tax=Panicum virgatum TaxID=38727 RepID=A0A8T0WXK8_PANVG|nr:hypothetical protein PVAP13_1NG122357 [Panicum virgatum]